MKLHTIEKLCCPFDKNDLQLEIFIQDTTNNILHGKLSCHHCKRIYPIIHGVPVMVPDEYRELKLETLQLSFSEE